MRMKMSTKAIGLLYVLNSATAEASGAASKSFVNSIWKDSDLHLNQLKAHHHTHRSLVKKKEDARNLSKRRHLSFVNDGSIRKRRRGEEEFEKMLACDQSFLQCLPDENCSNCFAELYTKEIDWASVTTDTECGDVIDILVTEGHCSYLKDNVPSTETFCKTFTSCALWSDGDAVYYDDDWVFSDDIMWNMGGEFEFELEEEYYDDDSLQPTKKANCDTLEKCEWPGSHANFIGDGICHDALPGCYNHKICGYDGGDCCKDTCKDSNYGQCGMEGFNCRNPNSANFSDGLYRSPATTQQKDKPLPVCENNEVIYRLVMYDSFGDGWDGTKITISPSSNGNDIKFNGGLEYGAQGTEYMCLSKDTTCYHVSVSGGTWGKEVSWEIKPYKEGAPTIADGGSHMECNYSVAGDACEKTCNGKLDDPQNSNTIDYEDFNKLSECISSKCILQVGKCESNEACGPCLDEGIKDYCYGMDDFIAVVDCTLCQCAETERDDFCMSKAAPGMVIPPKQKVEGGGPRQCSASETMEGSNAVRVFSDCVDMDEVGMMVTNFDNNHFGDLDTFEACAHSYAQKEDHGGHTALGCMQILVKSMNEDIDNDSVDDVEHDYERTPVEAIAAVSKLLYHNASTFCDCAANASNKCPLCRSFMHFKTLLFEVVDACQSLDEIDCAAWDEFAPMCKGNIANKFGEIDFTNEEQCQFVHETCGGAGPFPAFRRLDCGPEIPAASWDFWNLFRKSCLGKEEKKEEAPVPVPATSNTRPVPVPATSNPRPVPVPATSNTNPVPVSTSTPKPYISGSETKPYSPPESSTLSVTEGSVPYVPQDRDSSKPYVSQDEGGKKYTSSETKKKHWFRNFILLCLLGGGAYVYYQRRSDQFAFVRYRSPGGGYRAGGESEMYSSLSMDSGTSSFEPPSLPPTPSAI